MTDAALDRLLGVPSIVETEPGTPLQAVSVPVWLVDLGLRSGLPRSSGDGLTRLAAYLSEAYSEPTHSVQLLRMMVALLCSVAGLLAYKLMRQQGVSGTVSILSALLISFHPTFFRESVMVAGDSLAVTFSLASLLMAGLKHRDEKALAGSGFLFGTAVACKVTITSLAALPILLQFLDGSASSLTRRVRGALFFCFGLGSGVVFWIPYFWTDPIRFLKGIHGNVNKPGGHLNWAVLWSNFLECNGLALVVLWALLVITVVVLLARRSHRSAEMSSSLTASILIILPVALHSTTSYPRYLLGLLPCLLMLIAGVADSSSNHNPQVRRIALIVLTIATALTMAETGARELQVRGPDELVQALRLRNSFTHSEIVYVPYEALSYPKFHLSKEFYRRALDRAWEDMRNGEGVKSFVRAHGISEDAATTLMADFNTREESTIRHLIAVLQVASPSSQETFVYYDPGKMDPVAVVRQPELDMSLAAACKKFAQQTEAAILLPYEDKSFGTPLWHGKRWWWYVRAEQRDWDRGQTPH